MMAGLMVKEYLYFVVIIKQYFRCKPNHGSMVKIDLCERVTKPINSTDLNESAIDFDDLNSTIIKQDADEIEQILKETNPEDELDNSIFSNASSSNQQQQKRSGGEVLDLTDLFKKPASTKKTLNSRFGSNNSNSRISLSNSKSTILPNSASRLNSTYNKSNYSTPSSLSSSSSSSLDVKNLKDELTKAIQDRMEYEELVREKTNEINNLTLAYSEMQSEFEKLKYDHDKMKVDYEKLKRTASNTTSSNIILQLQQQVDSLKKDNKRLTQENLVIKQANKEKDKQLKENNINGNNNCSNSNNSLNDSITSKPLSGSSTTPVGTINRFSSCYLKSSITSSNTPSALGNTKSYSAINTSTPSGLKWKNF